MDINKLKAMIGFKIYNLRIQNDLTQEEFSKKLGSFTRGHISKIERGEIMPSAEFIREICIKFNVSPYWLLEIDEHCLYYSLTAKDIELINLFKSIPVQSQATIITLLKQLHK